MFVLLRKQLLRTITYFIQEVPLWKIALLIFFHCVSSWALVLLFEPGAEYARADTYWYFYFVTAATVGYGDFSPDTFGSRLVVTLYVMPIGIAILGVVIGKVASLIAEISEKVRTGKMHFTMSGHTVVVGDSSSRTTSLLKNILADETVGDVILLSPQASNPFQKREAGFVSGRIEDAAVCEQACLSQAARIIILADDDAAVAAPHCLGERWPRRGADRRRSGRAGPVAEGQR